MKITATSDTNPHPDANGNIAAVTSPFRALAAKFSYDAFGRTTSQSGPKSGIDIHALNYRFSTKPMELELATSNTTLVPPPLSSGLYYYGYRFYSPNLGRWISRDPIREQGGRNLYNFVGNDGVGKWDKLGLRYRELYTTIGAAAGAGAAAAGSVALDVATGGINIAATPAEIAAGGFLGAAAGNAIGGIIDNFLDNEPATSPIPIDIPTEIDIPLPRPEPKRKRCLPCDPAVGTLVYEIAPPESRVRGRHKKGGNCDKGHVKISMVYQTAHSS